MAKKVPLEKQPLADSTITRLLTYSQYSRYSLKFNIDILQGGNLILFWHIICVLQYKRSDLEIFSKPDFEHLIAKRFADRNDPNLKEFHENHIKIMISEFYKEKLENLFKSANYYKELYGEMGYDYYVRYYKETVNNPENIIEDFSEGIEEFIISDIEDFWPTDEECDELWEIYNTDSAPKKENALLNSIASLLHTPCEYERILAYYLIPERRIKLAEYPKLDEDSKDPYIIQPKLKRPITDNILFNLTHIANRYKDKEADEILYKWLEQRNIGANKLHTFISLILNLQMIGIEFIKQEIFDKVFERQIATIQKGELFIPPNRDDFFYAMGYFNKDKDRMLREIAVLVQEGYTYRDIYDYYKDKSVKVEGIVF